MKKQIWIPFLEMILTAGLILGFLTGCGEEKKVDYSIEGITEAEQPESEGGKSGLAQFEGAEDWKETLTVKIDETERNGETIDTVMDVRINVPITVPQVKQMSVVEVEVPEPDAEFKQTVAENIFEPGSIYYGDIAHLPRRELERMGDYLDRTFTLDQESAMTSEEIVRKGAEYSAAINDTENVRETYTPVEEYTVNDYLGSYEGRMYRLVFAENPGDRWNYYRHVIQIFLVANDIYEVCPEKFKDQENLECSPWMEGDWAENDCGISEEEALETAKKFVEQLGLDYPVVSYTRPLLWGTMPAYVTEQSEAEDWGIDGYVFYFDLGVDDLSFVDYGVETDYSDLGMAADKITQYSMKSQLQVYVTEQGVIQMTASNPVEITGISEGVELLPLETIKDIMREAMNEYWEVLNVSGFRSMTYDSMELIYFRVSNKEDPGQYSYVPAWRLGYVVKDTVSHQITIRKKVLINAIDGSFINFFDET